MLKYIFLYSDNIKMSNSFDIKQPISNLVYGGSTWDFWNSGKLAGTKIDSNLAGNVVDGSILLYQGDKWVASSASGIAGPQGPQGLEGPQGLIGMEGPTGPAGVEGPQGVTGPQGLIGMEGPQGSTGADGQQGSTGNDGAGIFNLEIITGTPIINTYNSVILTNASQGILSNELFSISPAIYFQAKIDSGAPSFPPGPEYVALGLTNYFGIIEGGNQIRLWGPGGSLGAATLNPGNTFSIYVTQTTAYYYVNDTFITSTSTSGGSSTQNIQINSLASYPAPPNDTIISNISIYVTGNPGPQGPAGGGGLVLPPGTNYSDYLYWNPSPGEWQVGSSQVHIGQNAGHTSPGSNTIAIGFGAGEDTQGDSSIAIGVAAGQINQVRNSIAIGNSAGNSSQQEYAISFGQQAGQVSQQEAAISIGRFAGNNNQQVASIALGVSSGRFSQQTQSIAIGANAGYTGQGSNSIAIGFNAGFTDQNQNTISMGYQAGQYNQNQYGLAIGYYAGYDNQGPNTVAIGENAGSNNQGDSSIAIGYNSGYTGQNNNSISLGSYAGYTDQGTKSISIGDNAGKFSQGDNSISFGNSAGFQTQGSEAISIGYQAGENNQGNYSISLGYQAGFTGQGSNCIAIGAIAGQTNQISNSIILNASGSLLDATGNSGFYVAPVRNDETTPLNNLQYNLSTSEITYSSATLNRSAFNILSPQTQLDNLVIGMDNIGDTYFSCVSGTINVGWSLTFTASTGPSLNPFLGSGSVTSPSVTTFGAILNVVSDSLSGIIYNSTNGRVYRANWVTTSLDGGGQPQGYVSLERI